MAKGAKEIYDNTVNEEAEKRAKHISNVVDKMLKLCIDEDLSINDFKVICNELLQRIEMVYNGQKVKSFTDEKDLVE